MTLFHEEYESDGRLVLFQCTECEYTNLSLGDVHAHCEKHRGYTRFNIQVPFTKTSPAEFDALMNLTKVLRVDDTSSITLDDVEGL